MDGEKAFEGLIAQVHREIEAIKDNVLTLMDAEKFTQAQQALERAKAAVVIFRQYFDSRSGLPTAKTRPKTTSR